MMINKCRSLVDQFLDHRLLHRNEDDDDPFPFLVPLFFRFHQTQILVRVVPIGVFDSRQIAVNQRNLCSPQSNMFKKNGKREREKNGSHACSVCLLTKLHFVCIYAVIFDKLRTFSLSLSLEATVYL